MATEIDVLRRLDNGFEAKQRFVDGTKRRLAEMRLSVSEFCRRIEISRASAYKVLNCLDTPRFGTAERWTRALALTDVQRREMLDWLGYVVESRRQANDEVKATEWYDPALVSMLHGVAQSLHENATFRAGPAEAGPAYRQTYRFATWLVDNLDRAGLSKFPEASVDTHLRLSDVCNVLNQLEEAFGHTQAAVDQLVPGIAPVLFSEALRCQAVVLNNQASFPHSKDRLEKALFLRSGQPLGTWHFYAKRDLVIARIGNGEAAVLEPAGKELLWLAEDLADPLLLFLARETLGRTLIAAGRPQEAKEPLEKAYASSNDAALGQLHRIILLVTLSRLFAQDAEQWRFFMAEAVHLAGQAGLEHQLAKLMREHAAKLRRLGFELPSAARNSN